MSYSTGTIALSAIALSVASMLISTGTVGQERIELSRSMVDNRAAEDRANSPVMSSPSASHMHVFFGKSRAVPLCKNENKQLPCELDGGYNTDPIRNYKPSSSGNKL